MTRPCRDLFTREPAEPRLPSGWWLIPAIVVCVFGFWVPLIWWLI